VTPPACCRPHRDRSRQSRFLPILREAHARNHRPQRHRRPRQRRAADPIVQVQLRLRRASAGIMTVCSANRDRAAHSSAFGWTALPDTPSEGVPVRARESRSANTAAAGQIHW
jgi:hypothetical protein